MANGPLTESDWKSFSKREKLDDPKGASKDTKALHDTVAQALQELGKASESKSDEMLAALDRFEDAITKQVAANARRKDKDGNTIKDTKEVKDQLYKMLSAAEDQRKTLRAAQKARAEVDEDEESPALLTTKMIPLIREVRGGDVVMEALIAVAGNETVLLLSRRAISPARGKLLKEQLTNAGGLKFIRGQCLLEESALTFVVQVPAAGLAKKIKAALLLQTDLRLKVRVRGEDPTDIDEEGEEELIAAGASGAQQANRPAGPPGPPDAEKLAFAKRMLALKVEVDKASMRGDSRTASLQALLNSARQLVQAGDTRGGSDKLAELEGVLSSSPTKATAGEGTSSNGSVDPREAFNARLKALLPEIKRALAGPPPNPGLKSLVVEANECANKGDFAAAQKALDELEVLITTSPNQAAPVSAKNVAAATGVNVRFQQSRLAWDQTRKHIQAELKKLEVAVLAETADEPDADLIAANAKRIYTVLDHLDERLIDSLDAALNATEAQDRQAHQRDALMLVDEYLAYVGGDDEMLAAINDNGFTDTPLVDLLTTRLTAIAAQLQTAVADH